MDLTLSPDQSALLGALDRLVAPFEHKPTDFHGFALAGTALERELEQGEYFDIAQVPELGLLTAAMAVERLAWLPFTADIALSMLLRSQLPEGDWPRPLALVENGRPGRFVATARTLILVDREQVSVARVSADEVEAVDSVFAYPMGRLKHRPATATTLPPADAAKIKTWLRIALAAEASGLLQAAIASATEHLSLRKQFGRPLGSFQALRHRMAECAVLAGGARWLMLKAAASGDPADAALAAMHAQDSATRVVYDLHQMLGAMGMTLEHPLHLWTYRLKALLSELGGRGGQAEAVSRYCFVDA